MFLFKPKKFFFSTVYFNCCNFSLTLYVNMVPLFSLLQIHKKLNIVLQIQHALLSVMERKEELQEQCQSFKRLLEKESATTVGLKQELNEANRKAKDSTDKMQARINSILRENELLKHQLKKYVGAVQKLRDGPQAHETLAQLEGMHSLDQMATNGY